MADVFDEVEEELRKERYQELFRKWGPWVLGAALAVIAGVAGYQWYDARQSETRAAAGTELLDALDAYQAGDYAIATAQLDTLAADAPRSYETLALLQEGAIAVEQGERERAAELYNQAAARAPDRLTRDVARFKALLIEMETLSYDDVRLRAEPLTEGAAPLGPFARELMGAAALKAGRYDEAREHYEQLGFALDVPQSMQRRASEALALIDQRAPHEHETAPEAGTTAGEGTGAASEEEGNR